MFQHLHNSKSPTTIKKYKYLYNKWQEFSSARHMCVQPASYFAVALFLTHLLEDNATFSTVSATVYAIKYFHEANGFVFSVSNPYIKGMLESSRRLPRKKVNRKDPISVEILISVCEKYGKSDALGDIRDVTIMLTMYAGFFRFDEVVNIRAKDIKFMSGHMEIYLEKSKTDQYRDGSVVCIAEGNTVACPVKMMEKYFDMAGLDNSKDVYIFRPLYKSKAAAKLISKNKHISYTRIKQCVLSKLKSIEGCSNLNMGLHSLRAGGATAAANAGVNERCLKRHGRWKTDTAKDMYVKDALQKRLEITRRLGL